MAKDDRPKRRKRAPTRKVPCPNCKKETGAQGLNNHLRACLDNDLKSYGPDFVLPTAVVEHYLGSETEVKSTGMGAGPSTAPTERHDPFRTYRDLFGLGHAESGQEEVPDLPEDAMDIDGISHSIPPFPSQNEHTDAVFDEGRPASPPLRDPTPSNSSPAMDDIEVEYHPSAQKATTRCSYDRYSSAIPQPDPRTLPSSDEKPWSAFETRLNFELAEFMQETRLNDGEIKRLLAMFERVARQPAEYSIVDVRHLKDMWSSATKTHSSVLKRIPLSVTYRGKEMEYEFWGCDIWDWCLELLKDPVYIRQMRWHATRLARFDGKEWVRFIDEPWTADRWWKIQASARSQLPDGAVPFFFILYADKTKLSSMGTRKGYPVYIRCANLPSELRNGEGLAGGRLVGWLPIVPEDADKRKKTAFVDFKRVVWHAGVDELFKTIRKYAAMGGVEVTCGDGIVRLIVPILLILIADYEEQCVMAAIRGVGSDFPCPTCLAPKEKLSSMSEEFDIRTTEAMKAVFESVKNMSAKDRNAFLQAKGLRNVENLFWSLNYTDVYLAISWDRLHAYHGGLFSDHLLEQFLELLDACDRELSEMFEQQLDDFPRWRDLNHFSEIATFREFSDGRKYEDLSKIIIFAAHNILSAAGERGTHLLRLMRSYLELDMYASLRCHTAHTLRDGREELKRWEKELESYKSLYGDKSWNFPKAHTHKHMFDDIELKGVTQNFNSKYNEKMHGIVKALWDLSNRKNIEPQLAKINSRDVTCGRIREDVDRHDAAHSANAVKSHTSAGDTQDDEVQDCQHDGQPTHVVAGSPIANIMISELASHFPARFAPCFTNIQRKISTRLSSELGRPVQIANTAKVTLYRYMKVDYASFEDSTVATDFLRMNKNFHGNERYDTGLFSVYDDGFVFAKVLGVLGVLVDDVEYLMAVVLPYDEPIGGDTASETRQLKKRDRALRFHRYRTRRMGDSAVIFAKTIVRGALLVADYSNEHGDEFLAVDVVDGDMWLRMKHISSQFVTRAKI